MLLSLFVVLWWIQRVRRWNGVSYLMSVWVALCHVMECVRAFGACQQTVCVRTAALRCRSGRQSTCVFCCVKNVQVHTNTYTNINKWQQLYVLFMSAHKCVHICVITGVHRSLGQNVSKVRSLKLDERVWTDDLIRVMHPVYMPPQLHLRVIFMLWQLQLCLSHSAWCLIISFFITRFFCCWVTAKQISSGERIFPRVKVSVWTRTASNVFNTSRQNTRMENIANTTYSLANRRRSTKLVNLI